MIWIILGVLMFMTLVVIHELGHFFAAKKSGVKVKEFGIWIPPKACTLRKDKSGTEYTLNRIPLGGFVSLAGEDPSNTDEFNKSGSFLLAKWWKKLIIISAGVIANLILAWVIFTGVFMVGIEPLTLLTADKEIPASTSYLIASPDFLRAEGFLQGEEKHGPILVEGVVNKEDLPFTTIASSLDLASGTIVSEINGEAVDTQNIHSTLKKLENTQNNQMIFSFEGEQFQKEFSCEKPCMLGVLMKDYWDITIKPIKFWLLGAMRASALEINGQRHMTFSTLKTIGKKLFSFDGASMKEAASGLTGPVGAVKFWEKLFFQFWFIYFIAFAGMISMALAIFNILPIPALDGGRFVGILIQTIFRIKEEKYSQIEGYINFFFFWILILLGIVILFKDLIVWWGLKIPFLG